MLAGYKKSLHQFFLKVHPDFFARNRQWQRENERSVAQLNEILEWGKAFKKGSLYSPPATEMKIKFHLKVEEDGKGGGEVQSIFKLPKPFHLSASYKAIAERSINAFLRDLLVKSSCVDESTLSAMPMEVTPQDFDAGKKPAHKPLEANPVRTLMEETSETLNETWQRQRVPSVDDLIEADLVLFDRSVSPKQCAFALETLRSTLPRMQYEKWYEVPMMFGSRYALGEFVQGVMTIPWNFDLRGFLDFIEENQDAILEGKHALNDMCRDIEQSITQICFACDLDDVLVSCGHALALDALRVLSSNAFTLKNAGVEKLSIEISDRFGVRDNGVLVVPYTLTQETLIKFLEKLRGEGEIQRCAEKYRMAKAMIDQTGSLLRDFRETVKPAGIDAYSLDCSYHERLTWAKELQHIAARLAAYDWSAFTFLMGPLEVNWAEHTVSLPFNFDGDNFVKYVDVVHQSAKENTYAKYVEEEEQLKKSRAEQASRAQAHAEGDAEMPDALAQAPDEHAAGNEPNITFPSVGHDIASQYVVTQGTDDAIHTESPIVQPRTFQSDTEAAEHLDWEGFHRDPTAMGKEHMQISEDQERAFYLLQRSKQEKIMREVMEEERDSRQTSAARKKTFGYYTGITDFKLPMRGADVKPKGTGAMRKPE